MYSKISIANILREDATHVISPNPHSDMVPDSKVHVANMGPTCVLSAPDGPRVGPMNVVIGVLSDYSACSFLYSSWRRTNRSCRKRQSPEGWFTPRTHGKASRYGYTTRPVTYGCNSWSTSSHVLELTEHQQVTPSGKVRGVHRENSSVTQTTYPGPIVLETLMLPFDAQVCHERQICCKRFHWIFKVILEMAFSAHCIRIWKLNRISMTTISKDARKCIWCCHKVHRCVTAPHSGGN